MKDEAEREGKFSWEKREVYTRPGARGRSARASEESPFRLFLVSREGNRSRLISRGRGVAAVEVRADSPEISIGDL